MWTLLKTASFRNFQEKFSIDIPILAKLSDILNELGDLIGSFFQPIMELIETIKELFNLDINLDGFLDILADAENVVEFLIGIVKNIIDQLTGLVPEEDLKELYEFLQKLLDADDLEHLGEIWEDIQYALYHGTLCAKGVIELKNCVEDLDLKFTITMSFF